MAFLGRVANNPSSVREGCSKWGCVSEKGHCMGQGAQNWVQHKRDFSRAWGVVPRFWTTVKWARVVLEGICCSVVIQEEQSGTMHTVPPVGNNRTRTHAPRSKHPFMWGGMVLKLFLLFPFRPMYRLLLRETCQGPHM